MHESLTTSQVERTPETVREFDRDHLLSPSLHGCAAEPANRHTRMVHARAEGRATPHLRCPSLTFLH